MTGESAQDQDKSNKNEGIPSGITLRDFEKIWFSNFSKKNYN